MSLFVLLSTLLLARLVHRPLLGRFGAGTLQHVVRLPGNLLHECAHAVAMLATGYTVADFTVSLADPAGRGHVRPGMPWIGLARPWLTNFVSPLAPIAAGVVALDLLHGWGGLQGLPTSLAGARAVVTAVDPTRWQLWVALVLGFSVTAEMSPSDVDFAAWWKPAAIAALLAGAAGYLVYRLDPGLVLGLPARLDSLAWRPVARALATAVSSGCVVAPIAWGVGKLRGA